MKSPLLKAKVPVQVVLGETVLSIEELSELASGSIIQLQNMAGEPVDLVVAGERMAKGEVVVIDENFGIRITEMISGEE